MKGFEGQISKGTRGSRENYSTAHGTPVLTAVRRHHEDRVWLLGQEHKTNSYSTFIRTTLHKNT